MSRPTTGRLRRERRTVLLMVELYCREHHGDQVRSGSDETTAEPASVCTQCAQLMAYAERRLERCPFGAQKPVCSRCTVHCYRPEMRERVRAVMRYAGPRMLRRHPWLAITHLLDRRQPPRAPRSS